MENRRKNPEFVIRFPTRLHPRFFFRSFLVRVIN
jgi:hypothetical protein